MLQFQQTIRLLENSNFYYIIIADMQGNYSYVNNYYAKCFEHMHGKLIGMPYHITMHADDTNICAEVAAKCFANPGQMFPATIRKHDGKGGYIITQWEYKAMINEKNEREGIFCLGYNITKFVAEGLQLKEAETHIEKKSIILDKITFDYSHQIRSPLSNILGLADILNHMEIDENVKNICEMIVESANSLDEIVKQVVNKSTE